MLLQRARYRTWLSMLDYPVFLWHHWKSQFPTILQNHEEIFVVLFPSYLAFVSIRCKTIHISLCFYFLSWSLLALQQVQPVLNPNNSPKNVMDLPHKLFWIVKTWEDSIRIVLTPTPRTQREVHVCDKDFLMKHLMWLLDQDCVTHPLPSPTKHWGICDVHIDDIHILGILLRTYPEVS